mmetsp:Transcript_157729/g.294195  ORF Transcript_157729/g.294195 Transcript_157729/m.294195 type:complete len:126 (+) Transcript_157729:56-433(+)
MGNTQCHLCANKRFRDGVPVGSYTWQNGFVLQNEPTDKKWLECKALIQKALPDVEDFVREEFATTCSPNATETATKLCQEWVLAFNSQIERAGYILDACGWTQWERDGQGNRSAEPKLALLIKLA